MKKINSILLALVFTINFSCNKDESDECSDCLGAFRCEINGEEWKPNCDSGTILWGCSAINAYYTMEDSRISLRVANEEDDSRIKFNCYGFTLGFNAVTNIGREFLTYSKGNCAPYHLVRSTENYVNILSVDSVKYIIEAEFQMDVINECNTLDTIKIRKGYFNLGFSGY